MQLKALLKLLRSDEVINLYDTIDNQYLQRGECKGTIHSEYYDCKVVGINSDYTSNECSILEIDIAHK